MRYYSNMELVKSHWVAEGNSVRLTMPISKVNKAERQVSGFATLDNVDQQDDVVLASASVAAFKRFKGNIREMHQPIAAGRLVDFKEDSFYDSDTKKFYHGIYVTVYVSEGAEDTWKKVLDGTLSGFSIGGNINDASTEFSKDNNRPIRFIKDYDLIELSLVDSPCNQFANVFSIAKSATGETFMKGMAVETELVNIFWCANDEIAKQSTAVSEDCLNCGSAMVNIGWNEKGDNDTEKMRAAVEKFLRQKEDATVTKNTGEGGVNMTDENKTEGETTVVTSDAVNEVDDAEKAVDSPEEAVNSDDSDETAKAAEVSEAPVDPDFEKMFDDLKGSVNDSLSKNKEAVEAAVSTVEAKITEVTKNLDTQLAAFQNEVDEVKKALEVKSEEREDMAKRLDALEKATAIKKSGEVEQTESGKTVQKGLWSGTFFKADDE